jgi:hypothetical protein
MQMNILNPVPFCPICLSGSLEEDWNVYERTMDGRQVMAIAHMTLEHIFVTHLNW